jgi:tRNA U38,U39,U40 pseudouridine synthase TruA
MSFHQLVETASRADLLQALQLLARDDEEAVIKALRVCTAYDGGTVGDGKQCYASASIISQVGINASKNVTNATTSSKSAPVEDSLWKSMPKTEIALHTGNSAESTFLDAPNSTAVDMKAKNPRHVPESEGRRRKRAKRDFDMAKFRQRHIAIRLMYDGLKYAGFAGQNVGASSHGNGSDHTGKQSPRSKGRDAHNFCADRLKTVEHELMIALRKTCLFGLPINAESATEAEANLVSSSGYSRCGRTDRGVSAVHQIIALPLRSAFPKDIDASALPWHPLDTLDDCAMPTGNARDEEQSHQSDNLKKKNNRNITEIEYCNVLNNALPSDIRAVSWAPVSNNFSARFSASSRTYRYFFVRGHLNIEAMRLAAATLEGEHDFRNFCKQDAVNVSNYRRVIKSFTLHRPKFRLLNIADTSAPSISFIDAFRKSTR